MKARGVMHTTALDFDVVVGLDAGPGIDRERRGR